ISENTSSYHFIFRKRELLVELEGEKAVIPLIADANETKIQIAQKQYFGCFKTHPCYYTTVSADIEPPVGMNFLGLRNLYEIMEEELLWIAGRALQLVNWDRSSQYCGECGAHTEVHLKERAKQCSRCQHLNYPRISPAIIVGVMKEKRILLANGARFPSNLYSVLAGFVEPGETLEECVKREIKEEVGIEITNIRYFGSQAWPFPDSLMIGFLADYSKGEIKIDQTEIREAQWFTKNDLPPIPGKISIARKIIDWFVENN
ncbi:MAG: NAD(+) diphosphatase, partial [Candidatus Hodarchaeales archaeon]